MRWQEKAGYKVPNMNILRGIKGRRVLKDIITTPAPDMTKLQEEVDEYVKNIAKERKNRPKQLVRIVKNKNQQ